MIFSDVVPSSRLSMYTLLFHILTAVRASLYSIGSADLVQKWKCFDKINECKRTCTRLCLHRVCRGVIFATIYK